MSRHRKGRYPEGHPISAPRAPSHVTPAASGGELPAAPSINGSTPPPDDRTAGPRALRAQIDDARREINARLDALAAAVDLLLPRVEIHTAPPHAEPRHPLPPLPRPDEQVYVPRLGGTYTVMEVSPDGKTLKVQAGPMRVELRREELWPLDDEATPGAVGSAASTLGDKVPARPELSAAIAEIDLHRYTEDEAIVTLELFLHHAFVKRTPRVRIIHGKGDGILRVAVRRELTRNPLVRSIDTGPHFRGDDGVTLADLDL